MLSWTTTQTFRPSHTLPNAHRALRSTDHPPPRVRGRRASGQLHPEFTAPAPRPRAHAPRGPSAPKPSIGDSYSGVDWAAGEPGFSPRWSHRGHGRRSSPLLSLLSVDRRDYVV